MNGIQVSDVTASGGTVDENDPGLGGTFTIDGMIFEYISRVEIADNGDNLLDPSATTFNIGLIVGGVGRDCTSDESDNGLPASSGCLGVRPRFVFS